MPMQQPEGIEDGFLRQIDVEAIHDGTFIFTVTERDQAPWGSRLSQGNLYVYPDFDWQ